MGRVDLATAHDAELGELGVKAQQEGLQLIQVLSMPQATGQEKHGDQQSAHGRP
jgi:hypothetical protein